MLHTPPATSVSSEEKNTAGCLVTVIVPVYNAEKYLQRCLESIIHQTYSNLEIILVDDGSSDNSRYICDEYAKKDVRVKVIHKLNGGVSTARNIGLDEAIGEYIYFVDSDDYVALNTIETLMQRVVHSKAEIVVFNYYLCYGSDNRILIDFIDNDNYDSDKIRDNLLLDYWMNSLCTTFYKKSLFDDIRFSVGLNYEDAYLIPSLLYRAKKIVAICDALYFYNKDNCKSITSSINSKELFSIYKAWEQHLYIASLMNNKYIQAYCEKKTNRFLTEAYLLNCIDQKLTRDEVKCLEMIICPKKKSVYTVIRFTLGAILKIKYTVKMLLKRNELIATWWVKHKACSK